MNAPASIRLKTIELAGQSVGVREDTRPNWGRWVSIYLTTAGIAFPAPWCAAFVAYKIHQAGERLGMPVRWPRKMPWATSSSMLYLWARREGLLLDRPIPGCVFLVRGGPTGYRHTGLVHSVDGNGDVLTIEGNIRDSVIRGRRRNSGLVFIRIA
jgi:hypothetical protein